MQLLAHLQSAGAGASEPSLAALVPRLWPFFRHTLVSVRLSTVRCLGALLAGGSNPTKPQSLDPGHEESLAAAPARGLCAEAPGPGPGHGGGLCEGNGADPGGSGAGSGPLAWLAPEVLGAALRLVFQNIVLEADARVLEASQVLPSPERVWKP